MLLLISTINPGFSNVVEARIAFKTEYDSLKQITDTPLDKPTTEVYDLRTDLQIHDFCENLNSEFYQPGPQQIAHNKSLTPLSRNPRISKWTQDVNF